MIRVFIAGPYTNGDTAANTADAMHAAHVVMDFGAAPFCPHMYHFMHIQRQRHYDDWANSDIAFLVVCDVLWRLPGDSSGADNEVSIAEENGIPVVYSSGTLQEWIRAAPVAE